MKKLLAVLLAVLMLLSIAACSKEDVTGSIKPAEDEFQLGVTSGGTYENAYIGIGVTLDDSWVFYSKEQIDQLNGVVLDNLSDDELKEKLKNANVIYDMVAGATDGFSSINICLENLGGIYGSVISEDKYIDLSIKNLGTSLTAAGYEEGMSIEKTTVTFAGKQMNAIKIEGVANGANIYQLLVVKKVGNYMALTTITNYLVDSTEEIAAEFYAVD